VLLKLTTERQEASRSLSATAELFVIIINSPTFRDACDPFVCCYFLHYFPFLVPVITSFFYLVCFSAWPKWWGRVVRDLHHWHQPGV